MASLIEMCGSQGYLIVENCSDERQICGARGFDFASAAVTINLIPLMFSGAHLHLLVNHAPIFGALFATALLIASYFAAPQVLRRTAFVVLIATAIAGVLADKTGEPAEDAIRGYPGVQRKIIHDHEEMGEKAYYLAAALGLVSIYALYRWRNRPVPGGFNVAMILASAFVSGAMVYTGLLGGRVRHTEVRPGAVEADALKIEPPRQRPPGAPRPD